MSNYTLHGMPLSTPCYKVALFFTLNNIPYDFKPVFMMKGEHKAAGFIEKNRFGQIPALEDKEAGFSLCQSGAILEYLGGKHKKMRGGSAEDKARVREWLFWSFDKFCPPIFRNRAMRFGFRSYAQPVAEMYHAEGVLALETLNKHLEGRKWMVGSRPTIADIEIYGVATSAIPAGHNLAIYPNLAKFVKNFSKLKGFGQPADVMKM